MSLSMYQASVPAFLQMLNNLSAILDKAEAYAGNRNVDPEILLNYRLAPDMLPFVRQIQITADLAKGAVARLASVEVPKHGDTAVLNWASEILLDQSDQVRSHPFIGEIQTSDQRRTQSANSGHSELHY